MPAPDVVLDQPHLRAYFEAHTGNPSRSAEETRALIAMERVSYPDNPAEEWAAIWIPNGDYNVAYDGCTYDFRIHLVASGQLAGKRIVKVKHPGSPVYTGFAFLTRTGGFALWSRYARDAAAPHVIAAKALVHVLNLCDEDNDARTNIARWGAPQPTTQTVEVSVGSRVLSERSVTARVEIRVRTLRCSHCNVPALRQNNRFALCADHTPLAPAPTPDPELARLIAQEEALDTQDRIVGRARRPARSRARRPSEGRTEADGPLLSEVGGRLVR